MKNRYSLRFLFILLSLLFVHHSNAQFTAKQVLIANGGVFGKAANKITIGSYDPSTKKYTVFDSVPGNSVTQVLVDTGNTAYMATDSILVKYDLNNLKRLKMVVATSLRYIALYKGTVCATVGEDGNFNHMKMFNKSDLSLVYAEKNIPTWCEGIAIAGDSAYIAVQGNYPYDSGRIAIEDLVNHKLKKVINLGVSTKGIGMMYANNSYALGVTENFGTPSELTTIDLKTRKTTITSVSSLNGPFCFYGDSLYCSLATGLGAYNAKANTSMVHVKPAPFYAAGILDSADKLYYLTGDNFTKNTKAYIYNSNGTLMDSFAIGTSPQGIAINYKKKNSGIDAPVAFVNEIGLYPNPARSELYISGITGNDIVVNVMDLSGKTLFSTKKGFESENSMRIPLENMAKGLYIINIKSSLGSVSRKFIKE